MRLIAAVLVLFATCSLTAATPVWQTDPNAATARARAEQKLIFVDYRAASSSADEQSIALIEKAVADEVSVRALDAYVLLRLVDGQSTHPIAVDLAKRSRGPLFAVYDHSATQLALFEKLALGWTPIGESLLAFRSRRSDFVRSAELRLAGDVASADFQLGDGFFSTGRPRQAAERFASASALLKAGGHIAAHQLAEIHGGTAWYSAGAKSRGRVQIANVIRKPADDRVLAAAWLARGNLDRADGNIATAISSYRKAWEISDAASPILEAIRTALAAVDDRPLPPKQAGRAVTLVPPARARVTGEADFLVQATAEVARVELFLDGTRVATLSSRPFRATIDVGSTPRVRGIKAVGYDESGKVVAESAITINDRIDVFRLSIIAPAGARISGDATIEIDARVPPQRTLERIDVFWNGEKVGTLTAPPYRQHVRSDGVFGYVRAVGVLDDGTTVEETRIYNGDGVTESVDVATVTLIASVIGRDRKPVAGLAAADFVVEDEGRRVDATLRSAEEEPVTIGIAVDSSGSMTGKQLFVIRAAAEFLERAMRGNDEAFVVAFDVRPRLVHARSKDLSSLRNAVFGLVPSGGTSIFDGVTFALQQFQGIPGKKALVVFSDGVEGTSTASARESERLARAVGVPLYVVIPPGSSRLGHALRGLSEVTGGAMFSAPSENAIPRLFDALAEELRRLYVLTFPRPSGVKPGDWRNVKVTTAKGDVRTVQGYRAN